MHYQTFLSLCFALLLASNAAQAGKSALDFEEIDVSYIYAAVMGTGIYTIDGRRIAMARMPFYYTYKDFDDPEEDRGLIWHLPVVAGFDTVSDTDWLETILSDDIGTLSVLPGVEWIRRLNDDWVIKPFANIGYGHDFISNENILMGIVGVRFLGTWNFQEDWELRWGNAVRAAVEYQLKSEFDTGFALWETGLDLRRDTRMKVMGERLNLGLYYRYQHYEPTWTLGDSPVDNSEIRGLHEVGMSFGLPREPSIFGYTISRIYIGYKNGDGFRGWTVGTEFPF